MKIWNGRSGYRGKRGHIVRNTLLILLVLGVLLFAGLQIHIGLHSRNSIQGEPELMIVFGCKVEAWGGPSMLLQDRLDTALDYLEKNTDTVAVLTGGQGKDESMTEAQAMANYLMEHGIAQERLLLENNAHNTWENVNCTLKLLEENGYEATQDVILVSNGFHLARTTMLWERAVGEDVTISTLAAPVSHFPSAVQMFFREPLALVKSFVFDR